MTRGVPPSCEISFALLYHPHGEISFTSLASSIKDRTVLRVLESLAEVRSCIPLSSMGEIATDSGHCGDSNDDDSSSVYDFVLVVRKFSYSNGSLLLPILRSCCRNVRSLWQSLPSKTIEYRNVPQPVTQPPPRKMISPPRPPHKLTLPSTLLFRLLVSILCIPLCASHVGEIIAALFKKSTVATDQGVAAAPKVSLSQVSPNAFCPTYA